MKEAKKVFGNVIDLNRIRVDDKTKVGSRKNNYAYVGFYTINLYGFLHPNLLIHELVHIWQYSQKGSVYIPRALKAQQSIMKYDYGGLPNLEYFMNDKLGLEAFNYEQQAEIVSDFYRLSNGEKVQWGNATSYDLPIYQHYMNNIMETGDIN